MDAEDNTLTFHCQADPKACAIVQTPSFRCLAYKDETGWHDAYAPDGPPLQVVWVQFLQNSSSAHQTTSESTSQS